MKSHLIATLLKIHHTKSKAVLDVTADQCHPLILANLVRYSGQDTIKITPLGMEYIAKLTQVLP